MKITEEQVIKIFSVLLDCWADQHGVEISSFTLTDKDGNEKLIEMKTPA